MRGSNPAGTLKIEYRPISGTWKARWTAAKNLDIGQDERETLRSTQGKTEQGKTSTRQCFT